MQELRNYPDPPEEIQLSRQNAWWVGEIHSDDVNRPVTMEYVACLYYPQGPLSYEERAVAGFWLRHVPVQNGPWDHFVTFKDVRLRFDEQLILPNGQYQILWQFDYEGLGVRICPKPSQINYVSLGDKLRTWGDGRIDLNWMGVNPAGHLAIGVWREIDGKKYLSVNGPDGNWYGIELTKLPPP